MSNESKGFVTLLLSFLIWGVFFPIYFTQLKSVPAFEVLANRTVWCFITAFSIVLGFGYRKATLSVLKDKRRLRLLFLSGIAIAGNWLLYIYGVSAGNIAETSLGYFICPIINILLGVLLFKEPISKTKKIAVIICFCALCLEIYKLQKAPFIALGVAILWASYTSLKKSIQNVPAIVSIFIEVMILSPFAVVYIYYLHTTGKLHFTHTDLKTDLLLVITGMVSLSPLLLYNYSVKNLKLTIIGFTMYLTPTLSLLTAILVYNEPIEKARMVTFILIWVALLMSSFDSIKKAKRKFVYREN